LGVLIFEMLSGHPPFYDNEPMGIYKKILGCVIEFPPFFSLRAKDIIRKLLNPIIERRLGVNDVKKIKKGFIY
jgi:serine/threonine protein kinase